MYLMKYSKCLEEYVGSASKFNTRFHIHESDIKSKTERCSSCRHVNNECCHDTNLFQCLHAHHN